MNEIERGFTPKQKLLEKLFVEKNGLGTGHVERGKTGLRAIEFWMRYEPGFMTP
jgi:hypothetical protein